MKVVIITEAGKNFGFGHLIRCMSLYQAFEERAVSTEFIVNGDGTVNELLSGKKHTIFNWIDERERLFEKVRDADITVIDSYKADKELYEDIASMTGVTVYMDDNMRMEYPGGVIVNGTIFAEEMVYTSKENIRYLLGTEYILLRKEFWNVPEKKIQKDIKNIMITFGGSDMVNMTPKVLNWLSGRYPEMTRKVIIGEGFENIIEIEKLKDEKTELVYYPDAEGMKTVMLESDIAISAGGQTLYELARAGVPAIAVAVAENQMNNIKGWLKAGFIEYAGWWDDKDIMNSLGGSLNRLEDKDLRKKITETGKTFVDGNGAKRVVWEIMQMLGYED